MQWDRCASILLLLVAPVASHAQKAEVAVSVGVAISPEGKGPLTCGEAILCPTPPGAIGPLSLGPGVSWQASFAYRLADFKAATLYVELPVAGTPSRTGPGFIGSEFSSVFFTPSAQLKFLPGRSISPFASFGGGLASFSSLGTGENVGAFQVGGGVDFKTPFRVLAIRAEARDFITGRPDISPFGSFTSTRFQHIFAGGGVVLKF